MTEATAAREFIKRFSVETIPGTNKVEFENGDIVEFENMTDEQAVRVAKGLGYIELQAGATKQ